MVINQYTYSKMLIKEHNFLVPLDYDNAEDKKISIFVREIVDEEYGNKGLPYLIFFPVSYTHLTLPTTPYV